ncbi:GAF domain-containing sensor histidine kinase [Aggregicoccus sp. 17bor-14]|uniref:GAF domain-containing sensor histidine kinase n=1 Tax=Myxococcaceae TaxID=31 RepID=UPI00129C51EF|nr:MULTISPECIES: GAF domain-containing sensor histidine kinase [Myxococcaceae]MBF5045950.1 GAF domain-containing sensor histidine kinase [Simulacricoccus sp. 17bor-14]MRI91682.1 GAF domain-containing sensor histidine kinase [Aggregicoccus sp. 17bor-14]
MAGLKSPHRLLLSSAALLVGAPAAACTLLHARALRRARRLLAREQRAAAELQEALAALRLLSDASAVLSQSLELPDLFTPVAQLAVPQLADWCAVELAREPGTLERVALVRAQGGACEPLLGAHALRPGDGVSRVMEGGRARIEADCDLLLRELAADAAQLEVLRGLGARCAMVVPLRAHEHTFGVLVFAATRAELQYGQAQLRLAEDLAWRCALALDNARLYREAQEAIRARDEFLSIASHELKTPLTSLQLHLQSLRQGAAAPERLGAKVEALQRQSRRLAALTDQLLDLSRIRLGRLDLNLEWVDLAALAREVAARFAEEAERQGGRVSVEAPGALVGSWDRLRLEQVLTNLLSNALKYGAGKPVRVRVREEAGAVQLAVEDRGIGIDAAAQARIFERFERAVSARHFGGLGLGLYIVREIIEAHAGQVAVRSTPGEGATFTVTLPRRPAAGPGQEAGAEALEPAADALN